MKTKTQYNTIGIIANTTKENVNLVVSELIKKELALTKGSGKAGRETAGTLKKDQVKKIAEMKMPDLNANGDVEASSKIVAGTARSMGVKIE